MSNEPKLVKAYKVSPELKERLERLAEESGLETQENFIEHMASLYELQQMKEGKGVGYSKQIEELQYHLRRPLEIFVGMIETESAERLQMVQQHETTLDIRAQTIQILQKNEEGYKKELQELAETALQYEKELDSKSKLITQLEGAAADKGMLVEQYKEKNDTLTGLVNDYRSAADENKELLTKVNQLTKLTDGQEAKVKALEADVSTLEELRVELLRQQEERHKEIVERLNERQKELIERLEERKEVEKERELLTLRTEYQAKLEKANEEGTLKIRDLYEQIRQLQQSKDENK